MPANQICFENLHFNSVYKESFSDTDDERLRWKFLWWSQYKELRMFLSFTNRDLKFFSGKENSETISKIHINITTLSKYFDNLWDILRDSN